MEIKALEESPMPFTEITPRPSPVKVVPIAPKPLQITSVISASSTKVISLKVPSRAKNSRIYKLKIRRGSFSCIFVRLLAAMPLEASSGTLNVCLKKKLCYLSMLGSSL